MPTQERLKEIFTYNRRTGVLKWKASTARNKGEIAGCRGARGYIRVATVSGLFMAHRIIWTMIHGTIPDGLFIDHINRKKFDNRITNLRLVTRVENAHNKGLTKLNKSGYKNIAWREDRRRWRVHFRFHHKLISVGNFRTLKSAIQARNEIKQRFNIVE